MNKLLTVFDSIVGYEGAARDDFFYEIINDKDAALDQIEKYAENALNIILSTDDLKKVYETILSYEKANGQSDKWHVREELND